MLLLHFKKAFPLTLLGHSLKEELTDYCFILKVTLFLHKQSRQRMVNTLLLIQINPTCKKLLILICQEKNRNLACISNKAGNKLVNMFFHRCSLKISYFSELA